MKVVLIIPTYNERGNVEKLVDFLEKYIFPKIKNHSMGILVVDDNSSDGTADEVKILMEKYSNISLLMGEKEGLGSAYIRGMTYAIDKMGAEVFFEIDADGQHDATKIPVFLEKIDEGYDMVIGTRYTKGGSIPKNWPIHRKMFSIFGNLLVRSILMRFSIHDWTGGYRALKSEVFLKEKEKLLKYNGYIFQISFLHKALQDKFTVAEVPFHFSDRTLGKSKIAPLKYIIDVLNYVISERIKELAFGPFGKFLVVGGTGFIFNAIILRILVEGFSWRPYIANLVGAVVAIFSNYNLNNIWTFKHHKVTNPIKYILKLLQFYLTSAFGVIFIQTGTIFIGVHFITSQKDYFLYFLIGTGFLLVWNFFVYSKFIWKKKQ